VELLGWMRTGGVRGGSIGLRLAEIAFLSKLDSVMRYIVVSHDKKFIYYKQSWSLQITGRLPWSGSPSFDLVAVRRVYTMTWPSCRVFFRICV
jgi:hypothetical protein